MVLYINYSNLSTSGYIGVKKKILAQTKVFERALGVSYYTAWNSQIAYLLHREDVIESIPAVTRNDYLKVLIEWIEKYNIKKTYIRYPLSDVFFLKLLQYQKANNIRSVLEIPTFPYDDELPFGRISVEDECYREMLKEYVDIISTYSDDASIWGKSCFLLKNGVDVDEFVCCRNKREKKEIVLLAMGGSFNPWHGYERLLYGLKDYVHERKDDTTVKIVFVGEGGEENYYKKIVKECCLDNYVSFSGKKDGDELDELFLSADIAISSLGFYKINLEEGSPIKGAEYCARGIPMVCGYKDLRFDKDVQFVLNVSNNDEPIEIKQIIEFYKTVKKNKNYVDDIRAFAKENLSWDVIMNPIVDFLK